MFSFRVEDAHDLDPGSHLFLWIRITQILPAGWIVFIQATSRTDAGSRCSTLSQLGAPTALAKERGSFRLWIPRFEAAGLIVAKIRVGLLSCCRCLCSAAARITIRSLSP